MRSCAHRIQARVDVEQAICFNRKCLHAVLTSALHRGEWSFSHPGRSAHVDSEPCDLNLTRPVVLCEQQYVSIRHNTALHNSIVTGQEGGWITDSSGRCGEMCLLLPGIEPWSCGPSPVGVLTVTLYRPFNTGQIGFITEGASTRSLCL